MIPKIIAALDIELPSVWHNVTVAEVTESDENGDECGTGLFNITVTIRL